MSVDEEEAWRRRIEWKLDRLAYHVTSLALAARTPLLPALPPPRRRAPFWPIIVCPLASYLLPALGTLLLLALGRLWEALLAAL